MKRWVAIVLSAVLTLLIVGSITLMAILKRPAAFPFLSMASAQRSQEYIQANGGALGYASEGVYVSQSSVDDLKLQAVKDLQGPTWKQTSAKGGQQVKFDSDTTHISIHARQSGGATIWIQEFRSATMSDRVRLWWKRHFH